MKNSPRIQGTGEDRSVRSFEYPASGIESSISFTAWQKGTASSLVEVSIADKRTSFSDPPCEADQTPELKDPTAEFERGRILGYIEGGAAERATLRDELTKAEAEKIKHALRLNEQFASEREHYLNSIGPELVELAIAIASLILRREVEVDPLLLASSVGIALREVAASTSVKIHVPVLTSGLWRETVNRLPNSCATPAIVADELLQDGECRIETEMGSADLGVQSQLAEISRLLLNRSGAGQGEGPTKQIEVMHS